jgi:hypothetical protein
MNPVAAWNKFFFGPISAKPLGLFRIVFGLVLLMYLGLMTVEFDYWYTDAGILQGTEAREAAGPLRFSPLNYVHGTTIPHLVLAGTFVAAVAVTLGWHTRVMSVLLYLGMLTLYHRNVTSNGGPDAVPFLTTFYLMFCPSGAAYSMDAARAARKRGAPADALIVPWGVRLLQLQLCLLYFQACVIKCDGLSWQSGKVVHYILFNQEFRQFDFEWLADYPLLINFLTHAALLFEFGLAFWLWFRPTRRWTILAGVCLHMGIRPVLNVPGFGETLIATYLTFLAADEVDSLIAFFNLLTWLAKLGLYQPEAGLFGRRNQPVGLPGLHQLDLPFELAEVETGTEAFRAG